MMMKRIAALVFALCSTIAHAEYAPAQGIYYVCQAIGKKSANMKACLKKHKFLEQEPGTAAFTETVNELFRISEHELTDDPVLKKQFLAMLRIGQAIGCGPTKEYAQVESFCDMAIELDPDNPMAYHIKACCFRETGNEAQAIEYEKIAKEKERITHMRYR